MVRKETTTRGKKEGGLEKRLSHSRSHSLRDSTSLKTVCSSGHAYCCGEIQHKMGTPDCDGDVTKERYKFKVPLVCVWPHTDTLLYTERGDERRDKARMLSMFAKQTVVCRVLTCEVMSCLMKCSRSCPSWWARQFSIMASTFSGGLGKYSNQCEHQFTV